MTTIKKPDWWDQWTEYDEDNMQTVIRDDAPREVQLEWHKIQNLIYHFIDGLPGEEFDDE